ncbi:MAG: iron-containing alcohol dehydrogenase, partial [Acidobacteriota bacterium]|nr:iron-containing alcohol dehydrogenase [Acidobacteriota bacterium]
MLTGTDTWEVELDSTRVVYAPGAIDRLGELARDLRLECVLVVTDAGIRTAGHFDRAREALEDASVEVCVYDGVAVNPG